MEEPYELPKGWIWCKLGEVCEINPKSTNLSDFDQSLPTTFVPMTAVDQIEGTIKTPEILPLGKARKGHTQFIENDVIFARITPCMENGKAAIAKNLENGLGFGSTEFHVIRSPDEILPEYIFYFVRQESFRNKASAHFTSTVGQMRVPKVFMIAISIPLPPLPEQHRIVAKLEAFLAQVNTSKDHLAKVPPLIKQIRQSMLAAARSGRLTEDWRREHPDVEPASELLKHIKEERKRKYEEEYRKAKGEGRKKPKKPTNLEVHEADTESLPELPEGWMWTDIFAVSTNHDGKRIPVKDKDRQKMKGEFPYYGASGIIDYVNGYLFDGDYLLIGEDGANLVSRSTPIAFKASGKFWVNNHAHVIEIEGSIPIELVEGYINGIDLIPYITGSAQPKLTQKKLNTIPIPLPPLYEQHVIVERIEKLFHFAEEVEKRVAKTTTLTDHLIQSLLAKAFRGELVPQDPNDESASVLLERIKKERAEQKEMKKTQKRKSKTLLDFN